LATLAINGELAKARDVALARVDWGELEAAWIQYMG
jgi:hypothetical protein